MKSEDLKTNKDYQQIISRLQEIQNQKELLKNMSESNNYNAHVNLPGTFEELIINLKRENIALNEKIEFENKKMLNALNKFSNPDKEIIISLINSITTSIEEHNYKLNNNNNAKLTSEELQKFYDAIKDLVTKIEANDFLLNQIYALQQEQDLLLSQKKDFESLNMNFFEKFISTFKR